MGWGMENLYVVMYCINTTPGEECNPWSPVINFSSAGPSTWTGNGGRSYRRRPPAAGESVSARHGLRGGYRLQAPGYRLQVLGAGCWVLGAEDLPRGRDAG